MPDRSAKSLLLYTLSLTAIIFIAVAAPLLHPVVHGQWQSERAKAAPTSSQSYLLENLKDLRCPLCVLDDLTRHFNGQTTFAFLTDIQSVTFNPQQPITLGAISAILQNSRAPPIPA